MRRFSAAPERFGFFIGERPLPAFHHFELAAHCAEGRAAMAANGHQPRHGTPVPLNHDLFAILDKVEEFRELGFGAVDAYLHSGTLGHFSD